MPPVLALEGLVTAFDTPRGVLRAVDGVSLAIEPGARWALVGESGAGKSLLARSAIGLVPAPGRVVAGAVRVQGTVVDPNTPAAWRGLRGRVLGYVAQDPAAALHPTRTLGSQLVETFRVHGERSTRAAERRAVEALAEVGLPDPEPLLGRRAFELSGGMRQRALVALALAARPALLIADEPTTALDPDRRDQLVALLRALCDGRGMALLLITHDLAVARQVAERCAVMYAGQVVETLPAAALDAAAHPYARALWRARPEHGARGEPFATIDGQAPDGLPWPGGCRFRERCDVAVAACATAPPETRGSAGAMVRCHLAVGTVA